MTEPFTGEPLGGARLLTGDAIITWRLMNEAYAAAPRGCSVFQRTSRCS